MTHKWHDTDIVQIAFSGDLVEIGTCDYSGVSLSKNDLIELLRLIEEGDESPIQPYKTIEPF